MEELPPTTRIRTSWRRWLMSALPLLLIVVAVGFAVRLLVDDWDEVVASLRSLGPGTLFLAFLVLTGGHVVAAVAWGLLLNAVADRRVGLPRLVLLFTAGQLGKYVPGAMWSVILQVQIASRYGIKPMQIALAFLVNTPVAILAGFAVGLPVIEQADTRLGLGPTIGLAVFVAAVVLFLATPALTRLGVRALRRTRFSDGSDLSVSASTIYRSATISALGWVIGGLHIWVLVVALGGDPWTSFVASVCGFALATALGSLAFFLPDGVGAREAVLVVVLALCVSPADALAIIVVSRVLGLVSDLVLTAASYLSHRWATSSRT